MQIKLPRHVHRRYAQAVAACYDDHVTALMEGYYRAIAELEQRYDRSQSDLIRDRLNWYRDCLCAHDRFWMLQGMIAPVRLKEANRIRRTLSDRRALRQHEPRIALQEMQAIHLYDELYRAIVIDAGRAERGTVERQFLDEMTLLVGASRDAMETLLRDAAWDPTVSILQTCGYHLA